MADITILRTLYEDGIKTGDADKIITGAIGISKTNTDNSEKLKVLERAYRVALEKCRWEDSIEIAEKIADLFINRDISKSISWFEKAYNVAR
ncbi:hypothetical protein SAMN02745221_01387, partial [Thermosyntropha lipolytica DSM 11003]